MTPKFKIGDKVQFVKTKVFGGEINEIKITESGVFYQITYQITYENNYCNESDLELFTEPKKTEIRYQYIYKHKDSMPYISNDLFLNDDDFKINFRGINLLWFKKLPTPFECEV